MGTNIKPIFYILTPTIQHYDWGNRSNNGFIKNFIRKKNKLHLNNGIPIAELWKGAHKKSPSKLTPFPVKYLEKHPEILLQQEKYLDQLIENDPAHFLGNSLNNRNIKKLPFLFKILDAEKPLSIQAHPDKKLAEILHKKDPVNYPDDNHKPELAISLGNFEAIVGFRPIEEIMNFYKVYPINYFFSLDELNEDNFIKNLYKKIMYLEPEKIEEIVENILSFLNTNSPEPERDQWFKQLIHFYGKRDPGLFSIYLYNYYNLKKGEAIFLGPNIPHAYLKGEILECMADSDNVVRGGLTNKFKDIEVLISMLNYKGEYIKPIIPVNYKNLYKYYPLPINDFIVKLLHEPYNKEYATKIPIEDYPSIMIILSGSLKLNISDNSIKEEHIIEEGEILFFPGDIKDRKIHIEIEVEDKSWIYLASTNL
ncbi:MAG: mannose-6-phosphate isomerase [Leptospiraceae bacterium]|nr:MAG: mannose-6-phosphate isomerase [Leptospiraceae bacterium]